MLRKLLALLVGACIFAGRSNRMEAQEQTATSEYDARALRLENSWGFGVLVRGREGKFLARIGDWRAPDVATFVASSPTALEEAKEFKHRYNRGNAVLIPGLVVLFSGAGVTQLDGIDANVRVPAYAAMAVGAIMAAYGGKQLSKAYSALGRSIWWHNRDLTR